VSESANTAWCSANGASDGVLDRLTDDMLEDYLGDDAVDNLRIAFDIIKDTNSSNVAEEGKGHFCPEIGYLFGTDHAK
jgi:hypothetical protein